MIQMYETILRPVSFNANSRKPQQDEIQVEIVLSSTHF